MTSAALVPDSPFFHRLLCIAALRTAAKSARAESYHRACEALHTGGKLCFDGLSLTVPPGVAYPGPDSSSAFVARHWAAAGLAQPRGTLLNLGVGSGALALKAMRTGWEVFAGDLQPAAVKTAWDNGLRNGMHLQVEQSDLFSAFQDCRFDAILFDGPIFQQRTNISVNPAVADEGGYLMHRFLGEAKKHLNPNGRLTFTYSGCSDPSLLARTDWRFELAACEYDRATTLWRGLITALPAP